MATHLQLFSVSYTLTFDLETQWLKLETVYLMELEDCHLMVEEEDFLTFQHVETEIVHMAKASSALNISKAISNSNVWISEDTLLYFTVLFFSCSLPHEFKFTDEVGFNLTKRPQWGKSIISQHAIVEVPGQWVKNITMCAAINHQHVLHHHSTLGSYNTAHLITFLDTLHNILTPAEQMDGPEQPRYIVMWDNISLHLAALVCNWFIDHPCFSVLHLSPYSLVFFAAFLSCTS